MMVKETGNVPYTIHNIVAHIYTAIGIKWVTLISLPR